MNKTPDMMKSLLGYLLCVIVGAVAGYYVISLTPVKSNKDPVDVNVHVSNPVVIHDTIVKSDIKYKYIYRNRCCCGVCNADSVKR